MSSLCLSSWLGLCPLYPLIADPTPLRSSHLSDLPLSPPKGSFPPFCFFPGFSTSPQQTPRPRLDCFPLHDLPTLFSLFYFFLNDSDSPKRWLTPRARFSASSFFFPRTPLSISLFSLLFHRTHLAARLLCLPALILVLFLLFVDLNPHMQIFTVSFLPEMVSFRRIRTW